MGREDDRLIREAMVEGILYPADPAQLRSEVTAMLSGKDRLSPPPKVIVCPYASYEFAGDIMASAFAAAAEVNADVKGAAADPGYALERAVLRICAARGS